MDKGVDQAVVGVEEHPTGCEAGMGQKEAGGGLEVIHVRGIRPWDWDEQRMWRPIGRERTYRSEGIREGEGRVCFTYSPRTRPTNFSG